VLLRHYVLLLRRRFYNICRALSRVERLVVNYVIAFVYIYNLSISIITKLRLL
jgi:hypothetical protein